MTESFDLLLDRYEEICGGNAEEYLTDLFKANLDKSIPDWNNPLRGAQVTGYLVRAAETSLEKEEASPKPTQDIIDLLNTGAAKPEKIKEIANYLDQNDTLGLSEDKVSQFTLLPFKVVQKTLGFLGQDFIDQTIKGGQVPQDKAKMFEELSWRNLHFGYLYRLTEELVAAFPEQIDSSSEEQERDIVEPNMVASEQNVVEPWDIFFVEKIEQGLDSKDPLTESEKVSLMVSVKNLGESAGVSAAKAQALNEKCIAALTAAYKQDTAGKHKDAGREWNKFNELLYKHSESVVSGIVQNWYLGEGRPLEKKVMSLFGRPDW
jgi:hypothetical protein